MPRNDAKRRALEAMKNIQAPQGELTEHLNYIRSMGEEGPDVAEELTQLLVDVFTSDNGIKCLILLENAVIKSGLRNGAPDSALRERNAVRNFVTDLKRIVAYA